IGPERPLLLQRHRLLEADPAAGDVLVDPLTRHDTRHMATPARIAFRDRAADRSVLGLEVGHHFSPTLDVNVDGNQEAGALLVRLVVVRALPREAVHPDDVDRRATHEPRDPRRDDAGARRRPPEVTVVGPEVAADERL